jgi:hypothetical protein
MGKAKTPRIARISRNQKGWRMMRLNWSRLPQFVIENILTNPWHPWRFSFDTDELGRNQDGSVFIRVLPCPQ